MTNQANQVDEEIKEPTFTKEILENGDKRITNYNSRGEVATISIERNGKIASVDTFQEGKLFEHTEYDENGKATSVTRYNKQGNAVGTQNYDDGKTPPSKTPSFTDVIATIYEKGKQVASKLFSMKFFDVAPTPKFMKELGLSGDKFTIKYGVISRHIGKDGSHDLSQEDWDKLPQALQNPFAIARLTDKDNAYRIYTSLQTSNGEYIVVGVDVKNAGREIEVNSISTVFGRRDNANLPKNEEVIYMSKEITPEQSALLKRPNFSQYPTDEELSTNKGSKKTDKTKIPVQKRRVTYFAKENKELGEYFNFYDFVLRKIATGQIAFIWKDNANGTKGLGSHLGLSKSNKERNKRIWMLSNEDGLYPEVAAEALLSQYAEEAFGQTEGLPEEITGMTTMDAFNTLMDVLQSYDTRNSMMQAAIELHNTGETEYLANLEQEQEPETINNQDTQGGLGNPLGEERNEVPFRQGENTTQSKPKAEGKKFTLSEQHKKELQAEATRRMNALRKAGKEFRAELNNNPDIVIVDKASDLPKEAFDAMSDEDKIASAFAKGWYSHNGKTYIILSNTSTANTSNAEDLKATLFHEAVAHKGLRELVGKTNFDKLCQAVYDAMPEKERERIRFEENYARGYIDEKGNPKAKTDSKGNVLKDKKGEIIYHEGVSNLLIADEYMADLAEQISKSKGKTTIAEDIVQAIRTFLRKIGINLKLNQNDIKHLLHASYTKLKGKDADVMNTALGNKIKRTAIREKVEDGIRARLVYHGSGAEFDRFDHSYMGTGEGVQAFGWGTYVTDVEGIGRQYASTMRDKAISDKHKENAIINNLAKQILESNNGDKEEALNYLRSLLNEDWSDKKRVKAEIKIIETGRFLPKTKVKAQLYSVDIPDDNGTNYIHWETNTQELADKLNDAYRTMLIKEKGIKEEDINPDFTPFSKGVSGNTIYNLFARELGGQKQASQFLNSLGFVGISYPAQATTGGRADGARNFVIFNEDDAHIVEHTRFRLTQEEQDIISQAKANGTTHYIVTNPSDIKSATDNVGTYDSTNPDIRFRLSEETEKIFSLAKDKFGTTYDMREAGYILPDGDMLNFSYQGGYRDMDHREISGINYDEEDNETGIDTDMGDFLDRGAIRIDYEAGAINLNVQPTTEQKNRLKRLIEHNGGDVYVDFGKGWDTEHYAEYESARASRVLGDIDRYYEEGIKPEGNIRFRHNDIFISNAENAVLNIKQSKATPEQWIAMLKNNGGLKAGEDKWLGLEDWLKTQKGSVTRQEVLDYIAKNEIQVEEVRYSENIELGDDFNQAFNIEQEYDDTWIDIIDTEKAKEFYNNRNENKIEEVTDVELDLIRNFAQKYVESKKLSNSVRLDYTTQGLERNREIALTVPTIESWNASDEIHFGDAGEGRAIAWIRFGETTDSEGNATLVIDEIQSKRHQEGREKGYFDNREYKKEEARLENTLEDIIESKSSLIKELNKKYEKWTKLEEWKGFGMLNQRLVPDPDILSNEEYNEVLSITKQIKEVREELKQHQNRKNIFLIPDAPFDKNWHELAMKRMLRLAAEEGYDKIAWTTGEQQADRYDMSREIESIQSEDETITEASDGTPIAKALTIRTTSGMDIRMDVDANGMVRGGEYNGKQISDVLGKELGEKVMEKGNHTFTTPDLKLGGEGMKGFYDKILPTFMNKYGKKWGVKTESVELPSLGEDGLTMHSVDVTPQMRESVMQGQTLFRLTDTRLRELEEGETSNIERIFTENKSFDFTSREKITSVDDVAFIFKQLQDESVENSFAVLVKDGVPTVIHLGMGNYTTTIVNATALSVAVERVQPDKIYFVHNHPSGSLRASQQDKNILDNFKKTYGTDIVEDGIIINLRSGKYATFGHFDAIIHNETEVETPVPVRVYSFNKQVFDKDYNPSNLFHAASSTSVAEFISSQRLGDRPKLGILICNNQLGIVGNIFTKYTEITEENADDIARDIVNYTTVMGGTRAVLFGNVSLKDISNKGLSDKVSTRSLGSIALNDYINVNETKYSSAYDEGVRFRLSSSNKSVERYDKQNGTNVKGFFNYLRNGKVAQKGEPKSFHIADAGELLQQYGIKGKFMVGDFTFSATHTKDEDHDLGVKEWVDVINNLNNPLAIASYKGLPNEYRIYTYATINGKNICVGVNVSLKDGEIALSRILSAYGRDIENLLKGEKKYLLYPATIKELEQRISQGSTTPNSWLNATSSALDTKVEKENENNKLEAEKNTENISFRLSEEADNILTSIEQRNSEAYNSIMNVELPKAETPIEIAKNKQTERTLFRFDKDFASMIALQDAIRNTELYKYNQEGKLEELNKGLFDSMAGLLQLIQKIEQAYNTQIDDNNNAYWLENASSSKAQERIEQLNRWTILFNGSAIRPYRYSPFN